MHAGRHYSFTEVLLWTLRDTLTFVAIATIPTVLWIYDVVRPLVPWAPIALLGTAVAFVTGFRNNASYGRLWEARQIWGAIVNTSRSFAIQVLDLVRPGDAPLAEGELAAIQRRIFYRHFAWLTALRFALRESRTWESMHERSNLDYQAKTYAVPEWKDQLADLLSKLLEPETVTAILAKKNRAVHLLAAQSHELAALAARGLLTEHRELELQRTLAAFYDHQGKCERLKNFPYPRQFATLNLYFVWLFILVVPFPLLLEFHKLGPVYAWFTIPAASIISWVLHTMDKIGDSSENPFCGGANDVPITAISRAIEIDLRELLGETDLPPAITPMHDILV